MSDIWKCATCGAHGVLGRWLCGLCGAKRPAVGQPKSADAVGQRDE